VRAPPFRDALTVEAADFLQKLVVLERRGSTVADGALNLVVADGMALPVGECAVVLGHD